jgi:hypothetical protein
MYQYGLDVPQEQLLNFDVRLDDVHQVLNSQPQRLSRHLYGAPMRGHLHSKNSGYPYKVLLPQCMNLDRQAAPRSGGDRGGSRQDEIGKPQFNPTLLQHLPRHQANHFATIKQSATCLRRQTSDEVVGV